ncbi:GDSL family lipase [Seonamhaeicola marinus]|uniref:GDSL family lipase n=2 Tax=Seonamhaeicola marinus TaxID=1912246 RepID=A0A5D0INS9_9FLAO|nr:GDSL family lipase [Seonamhaeicola marinus]
MLSIALEFKKTKHIVFGLFIISFIYNCDTKKAEKTKMSLYPDQNLKIKFHNDYAVGHYPKRIKDFKKNPLQHGDIVFIGNSLTEGGGDWSKKLNIPNIKNRGIGGDIADGVLERLDEITFFKPKVAFLLIGINDIDNLVYEKQIPSTQYIANNILKIVNKIHEKSPETKIFVQTILPTLDDQLNPFVTDLNAILKHQDKSSYELIDLYSAFVENDLVKTEFYRDRLHLNNAGYTNWCQVIKPYLNK